ncbi:MAG: hypothetical protein WCK29_00670 [archaeon]
MDLSAQAQKVIELNGNRGTFARFQLHNVSYYPTEKIQQRVAQVIYDVDLVGKSLLESELYQRMKDEKRNPISLVYPFSHTKVEGEVLLLNDTSGLVVCLLDIKRILDRDYPERNLTVISQNALAPNYHQVVDVGETGSIYTVDKDGSKWSLH